MIPLLFSHQYILMAFFTAFTRCSRVRFGSTSQLWLQKANAIKCSPLPKHCKLSLKSIGSWGQGICLSMLLRVQGHDPLKSPAQGWQLWSGPNSDNFLEDGSLMLKFPTYVEVSLGSRLSLICLCGCYAEVTWVLGTWSLPVRIVNSAWIP